MREGPLAALDAIDEDHRREEGAHASAIASAARCSRSRSPIWRPRTTSACESATLFAAQVDFTYAGDLLVFVDEERIQQLEAHMKEQGYLEASQHGHRLQHAALERPDLALRRQQLPARQEAATRSTFCTGIPTPPACRRPITRSICAIAISTTSSAKGEMEIAGVTLDLRKVKVPIYNLATREDHIAPAKSVLYGSQFFGGPVSYVLAGSGHIAGVVNPPGKAKYQYWTGRQPEGSDARQMAGEAQEHPGSWWPDWLDWLKAQDAETVPARAGRRRQAQADRGRAGLLCKVRSWG